MRKNTLKNVFTCLSSCIGHNFIRQSELAAACRKLLSTATHVLTHAVIEAFNMEDDFSRFINRGRTLYTVYLTTDLC